MTWGGPNLPSGIDPFTRKQQPEVDPVDDLSRFVLNHIYKAETEPAVDGVPGFAHETHGAIAHRYAGKVREDMVAFRRIVELYCDFAVDRQISAVALGAVRLTVQALAMRWSDDPGFRDEWRL